MTVLGQVIATLEQGRIRFAVIGATAMAAHGVSRATLDIDLLTTDARVLDPARWIGEWRADVRQGDADDPLRGVVRVSDASGVVDIVVGRSAWQNRIVEDARPITFEGLELPVADPAGLILLKLYAGGSQDAWDIEQLLAATDRRAVEEDVNARLGPLPRSARLLWSTLTGKRP